MNRSEIFNTNDRLSRGVVLWTIIGIMFCAALPPLLPFFIVLAIVSQRRFGKQRRQARAEAVQQAHEQWTRDIILAAKSIR